MALRSLSSLRLLAVSTALVSMAGLAACSSDLAVPDPNAQGTFTEEPIAQLYNVAVDQLQQENYAAAATAFDEVERQHPYSSWAVKAQMMAAYSLYMANSYDEAVIALDRFIQLHPNNETVDYAYYLKGLCYYEQISDVGRDQLMTELALKTLNELTTRFPESDYTRDAKLKIELTHDHLAGKEMEIGRYYQSRLQWLAAVNRFKSVIDKYERTTHVPEALHRLVESYMALGLVDEARKTAAVLGHNFPNSKWYLESYALVEDPTIKEPLDQPWYKLW